MLTSTPSQKSIELIQSSLLSEEILFPILEKWLPTLQDKFPHAEFKDADSDYLFATNKLLFLPGRHLGKKRNLIKHLQIQHQVLGENLVSQLEDAYKILENWQKEHSDSPVETDYKACLECIQNFHNLNLDGRIVYVDGSPAGFTIGERLTKDCYCVHFCKGLRSITGLYQFLYQDLAYSKREICFWINLEQDLGLPSIRESKQSYLPDKMLRKWRLYIGSEGKNN